MPLLTPTGVGNRAASRRRRRHHQAELVLSPEQQDHLRAAGYGPDGPPHNFTDPAVRADFVRALISCGALGSPTPNRSVAPNTTRRVG
jgi:hypothetical protein